MWVLGVVVRRYIDFLILLIPTPLVSVLFYSSILHFFMFFVLSIYHMHKAGACNKRLISNKTANHSIYHMHKAGVYT